MEQKFKRGNVVKILFGHKSWKSPTECVDVSPQDVGRLAIIVHSYNERYGGGDVTNYAIVWHDTGLSNAWKDEDQLEMYAEGGEHLITEAKARVTGETASDIPIKTNPIKSIAEIFHRRLEKLEKEKADFLLQLDSSDRDKKLDDNARNDAFVLAEIVMLQIKQDENHAMLMKKIDENHWEALANHNKGLEKMIGIRKDMNDANR